MNSGSFFFSQWFFLLEVVIFDTTGQNFCEMIFSEETHGMFWDK